MGDELQEVTIKKVGVFSFAGFFALVSFLTGIIFSAVVVSGVSTAVSFYPQISTYLDKYVPSNTTLIIAIPLTFLLFGFIFGIVLALIYNLIGRIGGIKLYS
ncbi:hypothetical protein HY449_01960 [Candidatus Pacearchaeota archaeon]|nr:hypothetical protein [Candidatus Pacearchaeota archaeon]